MLTLGIAFFIVMIVAVGFAAPVPGALLYLDARDNPAHPAAWANLGAAGGELPPMHTAPELEEGPIRIPDLRIKEPKIQYYTATKSAHMFGTKSLDPPLYLEDWTLEFLLSRNGNLFEEEHQLAGGNTLPEGRQGLRFIVGADDKLQVGVYHRGVDTTLLTNLMFEKGIWMWVAIVAEDKKSICVYQNGVKINQFPGIDWQGDIALRTITIGSMSPNQRRRNFNGSFSLVRIYDKSLNEGEIMQNIDFWSGLSVDPAAKLATTWAVLKTRK